MTRRKSFPFKLGADPEFNIVMRNMRVTASSIIPKLLAKKYKRGATGFDIRGAGNLGWDGCDATAELRPNPENCPRKLTANIGKMVKILVNSCRLFEFQTNSNYAPVGGHVHIEKPNDLSSAAINNRIKKLSICMLPLNAGENKANVNKRLQSGYGKALDWRMEEHGTIELRSPTAEWLTTPKICTGYLAFVGTCWNELLHHPKNIEKHLNGVFTTGSGQVEALLKLANGDVSSVTKYVIKRIRRAVKNFEFYPLYKDEIDYILNHKRVLRDKEKAGFDIIAGWKFDSSIRQPTKRTLLSDKAFEERAKSIDLDAFSDIAAISYNTDTNVATFAKALSDRILAHNWKQKNIYFLFGLKKGVKEFMVKDAENAWLVGYKQLTTIYDQQAIDATFSRMSGRFHIASKKKEDRMRHILIGIPYDLRTKNKIRPLIELVHDLENKPLRRILKIVNLKEDEPTEDSIAEIYDVKKPAEPTMSDTPPQRVSAVDW